MQAGHRPNSSSCTAEIKGGTVTRLKRIEHRPAGESSWAMLCSPPSESLRFARKIFEYSFHLGAKQEPIKGIIAARKQDSRERKSPPSRARTWEVLRWVGKDPRHETVDALVPGEVTEDRERGMGERGKVRSMIWGKVSDDPAWNPEGLKPPAICWWKIFTLHHVERSGPAMVPLKAKTTWEPKPGSLWIHLRAESMAHTFCDCGESYLISLDFCFHTCTKYD